jgi:hypothetical protein
MNEVSFSFAIAAKCGLGRTSPMESMLRVCFLPPSCQTSSTTGPRDVCVQCRNEQIHADAVSNRIGVRGGNKTPHSAAGLRPGSGTVEEKRGWHTEVVRPGVGADDPAGAWHGRAVCEGRSKLVHPSGIEGLIFGVLGCASRREVFQRKVQRKGLAMVALK